MPYNFNYIFTSPTTLDMFNTPYKYFFYNFSLLLFSCLTFQNATSQLKDNANANFTPLEVWEAGLPYIENYTSDIYKSSPQNWSFVEGNNGFMYMGNTGGVLQYDGSTWNTIELENKSLVRSLAKSTDNKIYVGGVHELGYLQPDEIGDLQFHSLISHLTKENKEFRDVWTTIVNKKNVFFVCNKYLFRWNGKEIKTWKPKNKFGSAFKINGEFYVESKGVGILKMNGETLNLITNGDILKENKAKIDVFLPYKNDKILLATADKGLLVFDGNNTTSLNKKSKNVFLKHRIYKSIVLSNGDYAFVTTTSGLYIIDGKTGAIKKRIGKKHGLVSDALYSVYEDSSGAIWVGSDNGISKIDWASPFRSFNKFSGLNERVRSIKYYNKKLLVDSKGLYQLIKGNSSNGYNELIFKKIKGIDRSIKFIIPFNKDVLAFDSEQVYKINKRKKAQVIKKNKWALSSIVKSKIDTTKIYAGTLEGKLFECTFLSNQWLVKQILEIEGGIEGIVEEQNGNLWLQTYYKGLYHAQKKPNDLASKFKTKKYDTLSGLPSMIYNFPYEFDKKIYVTTQEGMYLFNQKSEKFEKDTILSNQYDKSVNAFGFMGKDNKGTIWQTVRANFENKIYKLSNDKLSDLNEYNLFSNFSTYSMEFLDDIILFMGPKGVLLYNQNKKRPANKNYITKLRKVWINNDSLIFSGANIHKTKEDNFKIPFKNNNLKFKYTLPFYTKSERSSFQYILEGFDADWSSWSFETKKDYTNLPAGNYTFKVRSKNIYNTISDSDSYSFSILQPWYSTWWAYLLYGICAFFIFSLIVQWRSKGLQRKNETLEGIVRSRTTEIQHKNELLNHQTEKLVQLNEARTKLYANITHEFRTPLTVILGMADSLKDTKLEASNKPLEMIRRNGNKLLRLVNEMLDLAKLESGNMALQLVQADIVPFVKYLSESFHSLAEERKINLVVYSEIDSLEMDFDVNKMASIISNLLSNAIKFTQEYGKIVVHLNKTSELENEYFVIKVKDNGLGVSGEDKKHLFDRFYQVDDSTTKEKSGSGIGLSLVKEFVDLMKGTIVVESTITKGSTFIVKIPKTNTAIKSTDTKLRVNNPLDEIAVETSKTEKYIKIEKSKLPLVLIIEDNKDVAYYLKTSLIDKYQTLHAVNGNLGIKMALEHIPDIIISDVMMPGKDGFEVCETLKTNELTDHIPIIMLTAKATVNDRLKGLSHGADAYLAKPFVKEELFTRLDQLISVRKKMLQKFQNTSFGKLLQKKEENSETKFLQKAINIIHEHIDDSNFGASQLAFKLHLSDSQVYRKLKAITDKSTAVFIRSIRLQKGKELLQHTDKNISEVAYEVGFNDPSWFSKSFKEEFGFPPSEV